MVLHIRLWESSTMPEIFYSTGAHEDASPHELLFFAHKSGRKTQKGNEQRNRRAATLQNDANTDPNQTEI